MQRPLLPGCTDLKLGPTCCSRMHYRKRHNGPHWYALTNSATTKPLGEDLPCFIFSSWSSKTYPNGTEYLSWLMNFINFSSTWACRNDIQEFDPFPNEEYVRKHRGLQRAYALTLSALQSEQDAVEYWREFYHKNTNTITISDSDDDDIKLKKAIRMSLAEHTKHRPSGLLSPSPTPFESAAPTGYKKRDIRHLLAPKIPSGSSAVRNGKRSRIDNDDIVDGDL